MNNSKPSHLACYTVLAIFGLTLIYTAWICDDAFITFRSVENFIQGYGLRWNVDERVQSFTHPLWAILLIFARLLGTELYFSALALSIGCSLLAVWVLLRNVKQHEVLLIISVGLVGSRAFIDFSTSGLENPLLNLLIALTFAHSLTEKPNSGNLLKIGFLSALVLLTRLDAVLIIFPTLLGVFFNAGVRFAILRLAIGMLPFIAWEIFSLIYYGSLFPNTAYAKLGTGLSRADLFSQGLNYLFESISHDCISWVVILLAVVSSAMTANRLRLWSLGILLHILYIVAIGGDFMSGRFFAVSFFTALLVMTKFQSRSVLSTAWVATILLVIGAVNPRTPLRTGPHYAFNQATFFEAKGITDERSYYYQGLGLIPVLSRNGELRERMLPLALHVKDSNQKLWVQNAVGIFGYFVGPRVTVIDTYALTDPFLARLPIRKDFPSRVGHYRRIVRADYLQSLASNENKFVDPTLRECLNDVWRVSRAEIWNLERMRSILRLNLRGCEISATALQELFYPAKKEIKLGPPYKLEARIPFDSAGVDIHFEPPVKARTLKFELPVFQGIVGQYRTNSNEQAGFTLNADVSGSEKREVQISNRLLDQPLINLTLVPIQGQGEFNLDGLSLILQ